MGLVPPRRQTPAQCGFFRGHLLVIHAAKPRYTAAAAREHGLVLEPSLLTPGASVTSPFHTLRRWWTYGNLGTGHLHLNDFDKAVEAQHTMAISLKLAHMQSKAALSVCAGAFAARALLHRARNTAPSRRAPPGTQALHRGRTRRRLPRCSLGASTALLGSCGVRLSCGVWVCRIYRSIGGVCRVEEKILCGKH